MLAKYDPVIRWRGQSRGSNSHVSKMDLTQYGAEASLFHTLYEYIIGFCSEEVAKYNSASNNQSLTTCIIYFFQPQVIKSRWPRRTVYFLRCMKSYTKLTTSRPNGTITAESCLPWHYWRDILGWPMSLRREFNGPVGSLKSLSHYTGNCKTVIFHTHYNFLPQLQLSFQQFNIF